MSKMMSDLMAKQRKINVVSQSEIPPPTRQGLRLDKSPMNTNPTLQLDDAIVIDTSTSPSVPCFLIHPPMMRIPSCWPNSTKGYVKWRELKPVCSRMLVTAAQSFGQLIAMGEEIETGLKKGWYSESGSSSKRFTSKMDKEHAPEVNMTYVQKTPPGPETTIYHPPVTSYGRQGQSRTHAKNANLAG
ncbi:hypothetical protein NL676_039440 [Syzygium grande]|nr:hypothetical protein NL676_039440 [Syzygium grande]